MRSDRSRGKRHIFAHRQVAISVRVLAELPDEASAVGLQPE